MPSTNYFGKRLSGDMCRSPISDDRGLAEFDCSACCNVAVDWQSISATRISSDMGHPVPEFASARMGSNIYILYQVAEKVVEQGVPILVRTESTNSPHAFNSGTY